MRDTMIYARVGRRIPTTPSIVEQAGGFYKGMMLTNKGTLVMFDDAQQDPPRSTLSVDYDDMHKSGYPVEYVRKHIQESRKKFKEAL